MKLILTAVALIALGACLMLVVEANKGMSRREYAVHLGCDKVAFVPIEVNQEELPSDKKERKKLIRETRKVDKKNKKQAYKDCLACCRKCGFRWADLHGMSTMVCECADTLFPSFLRN